MKGVKTAKVKLAVDDAAASKTIETVKTRLRALAAKVYKAGVTGEDKEAQLRLQRMALALRKLSKTVANPKISVEGAARAQVAMFSLERQFARVSRQIDGTRSKTQQLASALSKATPLWTAFVSAGIALGPALIPILATLTAGVLSMGTALVGAGSALGLFFVAAKSNFTAAAAAAAAVQSANLRHSATLRVLPPPHPHNPSPATTPPHLPPPHP